MYLNTIALVLRVSDYNDRIAQLEAEKTALIESVGENIHEIKTNVSGYFYTEADGYEEAFSEIENLNSRSTFLPFMIRLPSLLRKNRAICSTSAISFGVTKRLLVLM